MTRNLKATGLALLAVFALGAVGAQSVSAAVSHTFISSSASTVLTGTTESASKETFKLTSAAISCEDIVYRGTMTGVATDHIALYPDFSGASTKCSAGALGAATITNHGCTWTYDSDTIENPTHFGAGQEHANVSLACGHEKSLSMAAGGCTMTFSDTHPGVTVNQGLPGVRYTTVANHSGGKSAITDSWTVRTLKATTVGANCVLVGLGNPGTHVNGTWEGQRIITGYEDLGGTGHGPFVEGALVNLGLSTP